MERINKPNRISKRNMGQVAVDLTLLLCFLYFAYTFLPDFSAPSPLSPLIPPRQVGSGTLPLKEIWRIQVGALRYPGHNNVYPWQSTKQGVVISTNRGLGTEQLTLVDSQNGQIRWQVTTEAGSNSSLVVDAARIYLVNNWRINAYDLNTGHLLWQTNKQLGHRGYDLYLRDGVLVEYEVGHDLIYKFDRLTGTKVETETLPAETPMVIASLAEIDLGRDRYWLSAIDRKSQSVLWRVPRGVPPNNLDGLPVEVAGLLIMTDNSTLYISKLDTGEIIWQQPDIVSNPIVLDNLIYVIAADANIRAYDLHSGQVMGSLHLQPPVIIDQGYALTANSTEQTIYAYYGDGQEVIAFGR